MVVRHSCNSGAICTCRHYRDMYSCVSDWLRSQVNCSSTVVTIVHRAVLRFTVPFTSNYNCPVIAAGASGRLFLRGSFFDRSLTTTAVLTAVFRSSCSTCSRKTFGDKWRFQLLSRVWCLFSPKQRRRSTGRNSVAIVHTNEVGEWWRDCSERISRLILTETNDL